MENGWLTTGPSVAAFEAAFARAAGIEHAVALNSCTAALHIGLIAAGVRAGDDVVMPSLTFVAGAQCALEIGARPVFCDVDEETLSAGVDQFAAAITPKTRALIAMPYAGRPLGMARLARFARERGIALIEDAAHAAGTLDCGKWAGTHSTLAAYSFYATKNLTTGEGGMLLTNDAAIAARARALGLHGMDKDAWKRYTAAGSWRYDVHEPGFKYNMPDLAAAMGIVQLGRLETLQRRRAALAQRYNEAFAAMPGIMPQAPVQESGDRHSWCMYVLRVDEKRTGLHRDALIEELRARNIGTSVHYIPTHRFSAYRALAQQPLPATERVAGQIISLPLYPGMSDADADDAIEAVKSALLGQKQAGASLARAPRRRSVA